MLLEVLDKLYPFLRFVPVLEWMVMASVSSAAKKLLQRPALWQAACRLSVMKSGDEQGGCVNDVAQWAPGALCAMALWMSRVCASRTSLDLLVGTRFPLLSPLCLHSHCAFEYLQIDSAVLEVRRAAMIGAKMWEAGMLLCALLARDETTWPLGLERMKGGSVLELGSGLGLVGVAVPRHCRPSTMVLTGAEPSCLKLADGRCRSCVRRGLLARAGVGLVAHRCRDLARRRDIYRCPLGSDTLKHDAFAGGSRPTQVRVDSPIRLVGAPGRPPTRALNASAAAGVPSTKGAAIGRQ